MADYGIQMRNADGSLVLNGRQTLPRLVDRVTVGQAFTGDLGPFPDFDEDRGAVFVMPHSFRYNIETGQRYGIAAGPVPFALSVCNSVALPSFTWNNTTKILSVVAAPTYGGLRSDWRFTFIHYR